ncbi:MAG: PD40 domain-containing protein, partial [Flavobacterium sp.]|nr:PD40 domain-containing protein [Flavobacterium sp.]
MPSDLGGKQYGIKRILGKPDAFPQAGNSPNAWAPKNALKYKDVLEVGFEKPQAVKQVAVFENLNSGSVVKISVADASGNYQVVWTRQMDYKTPLYRTTLTTDRAYYFKRKRRKVEEVPDVNFNPGIERAILENVINNVVSVRVQFDFAIMPGQKQIDAIGISDSELPLEAKINLKPQFEQIDQPKTVNTEQWEAYAPMVSYDGKKLFFTTDINLQANNDDHDAKIFSLSKSQNGSWEHPIEENSNLNANPKYNYLNANYEHFIVRGGKSITVGNPDSGFEILENNGTYTVSESIKIVAFNNYDDAADLTITADKKIIMLALESDFSQGGSDIYFSTKKDDGTYNILQNAGKVLNSAADEINIQLLSDQKTLLFASDGFSGYGSFDIFVSHRLDDSWKNWSEPINLGSKINTPSFEGSNFYDE